MALDGEGANSVMLRHLRGATAKGSAQCLSLHSVDRSSVTGHSWMKCTDGVWEAAEWWENSPEN